MTNPPARLGTAPLRSSRWLSGDGEVAVSSRAAMRSVGVALRRDEARPVIGIANTASDLNPCNVPLRRLSLAVREGIEAAGGIPMEFCAMSLGEDLMKPTAMLYRNLLAIEIEEMLRANPLDGVVLLANCDKTVPGMVMGALSTDLPFLVVTGGSRPPACYAGERLGSGTDLWRYWERRRVGEIDDATWAGFEQALSMGLGACNTMGTASTMAILTEVLGLSLPGSATLASDCAEIAEHAREAGERITLLARDCLHPSEVLKRSNFENAIRVLSATGGSTNAVIHLTAMARRAGIDLSLDDFATLGASVPVVVDVEPTGTGLIGDFAVAGGVPTLCKSIAAYLDLDTGGMSGHRRGEIVATARPPGHPILLPESPKFAQGSICVVKGNLAPDGAIIRVSTAEESLQQHTGPAMVFDGYQEMLDRIDDPALALTKDSVLVLRGCGPVGGPAMPEWGMIPIPEYLRRQGVTDMVRISDARMSGTSFGTVVLHVAPEAAIGGPLALLQTGDMVCLDVKAGLLTCEVTEEELQERRLRWVPPASSDLRGWVALYCSHVSQAPLGCDFDFLQTRPGLRPSLVEPTVGRS